MAREIMQGEDFGVGRIIARPFDTVDGVFKRTAERHDYSIEAPDGLLPETLMKAGLDSIAVGKISDIFAAKGFTKAIYTHSNTEGMEVTDAVAAEDFHGLCFVNLVDFDMLWGHRRDAVLYAEGLNAFDKWLGGFAEKLGEDDLLMITADHGCDPAFTKTTDHTREYTPLIMYRKGADAVNYGTVSGFNAIAATAADALGVQLDCGGKILA